MTGSEIQIPEVDREYVASIREVSDTAHKRFLASTYARRITEAINPTPAIAISTVGIVGPPAVGVSVVEDKVLNAVDVDAGVMVTDVVTPVVVLGVLDPCVVAIPVEECVEVVAAVVELV
jgi:hypothetical protein